MGSHPRMQYSPHQQCYMCTGMVKLTLREVFIANIQKKGGGGTMCHTLTKSILIYITDILAGYFIVLFIIFIWNNVYNMFNLLLMCLLHYIKT
jgi:hypothetical protein